MICLTSQRNVTWTFSRYEHILTLGLHTIYLALYFKYQCLWTNYVANFIWYLIGRPLMTKSLQKWKKKVNTSVCCTFFLFLSVFLPIPFSSSKYTYHLTATWTPYLMSCYFNLSLPSKCHSLQLPRQLLTAHMLQLIWWRELMTICKYSYSCLSVIALTVWSRYEVAQVEFYE